MSRRFTVTIECPRLFFEDGQPVQCECDVRVECEADGAYRRGDYWSPAEAPELYVLGRPTFCTHADGKMDVAYTAVECAEWVRRAEIALDAYEPVA